MPIDEADTTTSARRKLLWTIAALALTGCVYFSARDWQRGQVTSMTSILLLTILLNTALRLGAFRTHPRLVNFLNGAGLLFVVGLIAFDLFRRTR